MSLLNISPAAVGLSSLTEMVISGEMGATTAAGAAALTGTRPMAPDADSAAFAAALNAAGAAYHAAVGEHVGQRAAYAGTQSLASVSFLLNELLSAATLTIT
jgi:hypothetical protein